MAQAVQDLIRAEYNRSAGYHDLVCFVSQQAAEKALKAFLYAKGEERVLGHSVNELCKWISKSDTDFLQLGNECSTLDTYYIPTRYPNGLPGGIPAEVYNGDDSERAIRLAKKVLEHVRSKLPELDA